MQSDPWCPVVQSVAACCEAHAAGALPGLERHSWLWCNPWSVELRHWSSIRYGSIWKYLEAFDDIVRAFLIMALLNLLGIHHVDYLELRSESCITMMTKAWMLQTGQIARVQRISGSRKLLEQAGSKYGPRSNVSFAASLRCVSKNNDTCSRFQINEPTEVVPHGHCVFSQILAAYQPYEIRETFPTRELWPKILCCRIHFQPGFACNASTLGVQTVLESSNHICTVAPKWTCSRRRELFSRKSSGQQSCLPADNTRTLPGYPKEKKTSIECYLAIQLMRIL